MRSSRLSKQIFQFIVILALVSGTDLPAQDAHNTQQARSNYFLDSQKRIASGGDYTHIPDFKIQSSQWMASKWMVAEHNYRPITTALIALEFDRLSPDTPQANVEDAIALAQGSYDYLGPNRPDLDGRISEARTNTWIAGIEGVFDSIAGGKKPTAPLERIKKLKDAVKTSAKNFATQTKLSIEKGTSSLLANHAQNLIGSQFVEWYESSDLSAIDAVSPIMLRLLSENPPGTRGFKILDDAFFAETGVHLDAPLEAWAKNKNLEPHYKDMIVSIGLVKGPHQETDQAGSKRPAARSNSEQNDEGAKKKNDNAGKKEHDKNKKSGEKKQEVDKETDVLQDEAIENATDAIEKGSAKALEIAKSSKSDQEKKAEIDRINAILNFSVDFALRFIPPKDRTRIGGTLHGLVNLGMGIARILANDYVGGTLQGLGGILNIVDAHSGAMSPEEQILINLQTIQLRLDQLENLVQQGNRETWMHMYDHFTATHRKLDQLEARLAKKLDSIQETAHRTEGAVRIESKKSNAAFWHKLMTDRQKVEAEINLITESTVRENNGKFKQFKNALLTTKSKSLAEDSSFLSGQNIGWLMGDPERTFCDASGVCFGDRLGQLGPYLLSVNPSMDKNSPLLKGVISNGNLTATGIQNYLLMIYRQPHHANRYQKDISRDKYSTGGGGLSGDLEKLESQVKNINRVFKAIGTGEEGDPLSHIMSPVQSYLVRLKQLENLILANATVDDQKKALEAIGQSKTLNQTEIPPCMNFDPAGRPIERMQKALLSKAANSARWDGLNGKMELPKNDLTQPLTLRNDDKTTIAKYIPTEFFLAQARGLGEIEVCFSDYDYCDKSRTHTNRGDVTSDVEVEGVACLLLKATFKGKSNIPIFERLIRAKDRVKFGTEVWEDLRFDPDVADASLRKGSREYDEGMTPKSVITKEVAKGHFFDGLSTSQQRQADLSDMEKGLTSVRALVESDYQKEREEKIKHLHSLLKTQAGDIGDHLSMVESAKVALNDVSEAALNDITKRNPALAAAIRSLPGEMELISGTPDFVKVLANIKEAEAQITLVHQELEKSLYIPTKFAVDAWLKNQKTANLEKLYSDYVDQTLTARRHLGENHFFMDLENQLAAAKQTFCQEGDGGHCISEELNFDVPHNNPAELLKNGLPICESNDATEKYLALTAEEKRTIIQSWSRDQQFKHMIGIETITVCAEPGLSFLDPLGFRQVGDQLVGPVNYINALVLRTRRQTLKGDITTSYSYISAPLIEQSEIKIVSKDPEKIREEVAREVEKLKTSNHRNIRTLWDTVRPGMKLESQIELSGNEIKALEASARRPGLRLARNGPSFRAVSRPSDSSRFIDIVSNAAVARMEAGIREQQTRELPKWATKISEVAKFHERTNNEDYIYDALENILQDYNRRLRTISRPTNGFNAARENVCFAVKIAEMLRGRNQHMKSLNPTMNFIDGYTNQMTTVIQDLESQCRRVEEAVRNAKNAIENPKLSFAEKKSFYEGMLAVDEDVKRIATQKLLEMAALAKESGDETAKKRYGKK